MTKNHKMIDMVFCKGGSFLMGSPENEVGHHTDEKQRQVEVEDFFIGKYPVTNSEYRLFKPDHNSGHGFNGDDQPVVMVSWYDATAYAEWIGQQMGEEYRLPEEWEWEYACRAGTTTKYFFGNNPENLGEYAWFICNSGKHTNDVGKKKPNPWGLYDMLGNVWEWTSTVVGLGIVRSARGGSCMGLPRISRRGCNGVSLYRYNDFGFRLAKDSEERKND